MRDTQLVYFELTPDLDLDLEGELGPQYETVLMQALNRIAAKARTNYDRQIRKEVNFPASYLRPSARRLWVKQKAKPSALEAVITGRDRATSLARFTKQKPLDSGNDRRRGPINVQVKPGQTRRIKRAFLVRLNNNNVGLAVRTNGEKPRGAYKPTKLSKNAYLLYGPSVDQALVSASSGDGIVERMQGQHLDMLNAEIDRLLKVRGLAK